MIRLNLLSRDKHLPSLHEVQQGLKPAFLKDWEDGFPYDYLVLETF